MSSGLQGMKQAPGHGTHLIEALEGLGHPRPMYGAGGGEQSEVAFGLLGRGISRTIHEVSAAAADLHAMSALFAARRPRRTVKYACGDSQLR